MFKKEDSPWLMLVLSLILIGNNVYVLLYIDEGHVWRGAFIPTWVSWIILPLACLMAALSIRVLLRRRKTGPPPPKTYTDEDVKRAEAEMDAMYAREYGEPPVKPEKKE